ncbi:hypothetical protein [Labedella endophytica]|uniref:Uncharacterized protein n=1 Tax=Labedella endophytica TaxID=1523160 RepID=A0A3S0XWF7_9MICO|nr:hypothetical protein [Labedella endophytica]RUQ96906.1 hypothetical protein ELQ94_16795 [Labedella endophytica]
MSRFPSWRKALAVPVALTLAFGSALLATAPASAAPEDLTVTSPESGDTVESRTVVFAGTGTEGSLVAVTDAEGTPLPGTTPATVTAGLWTTTATYDDDAAIEQTAFVEQTTADLADGETSVTFSLPAAVVPDPEIEFAITSPEDGDTLESRTVEITGTGTDDSAVVLTDADGAVLPGTTAATVVDGAWTATATYPEDAIVDQSITATQVTELVETGEDTIAVTLPDAALPDPEPEAEFAITSPEDGADLDSYTVVFEGTGTNGSTVDLLDYDDEPLAGADTATVSGGVWSITVEFPEDADPFQFVTAVQTTDGEEEYAYVAFYFPYELLPAPVITSPANGETVEGDQVTFTGTATPGTDVLVAIIPTSELEELEELGDEMSANARAAAEPSDPEDPIAVDENGDWTVTYALAPDDYTVAAILVDLEQGLLLSDVSEFVEFSLIAAAAVDNPGDGNGDDDGEGLAVTGSESGGFVGLAGAFLLAGVLALAARTRFARTE